MLAENFQGERAPLVPVGGRTSYRSGGPLQGSPLPIVTSELNRVIDYPSRDMTITLEAGMRIEELREILAEEKQRLPIDVPQSHRATLGGAIASNVSGPGRYGHGTFRDYVIGISAVDGQGRLFSAGGRVVKNVAGYDICKLLVGSMGTLAVITQVTLKLRPLAASRGFACVAASDWGQVQRVLERMNTSASRPVALDVLNPRALFQLQKESPLGLENDRPALCIGVEGTERERDWQLEQVQREVTETGCGEVTIQKEDEADRLWESLVEFQTASDDPLSFRASLQPSQVVEFLEWAGAKQIALQAHAGNGVVIGHFSDRVTDVESATALVGELRTFVERKGGHLHVLQCDEDWKPRVGVYGRAFPGESLMKGIKEALDPASVLSPGRFW